MASVDDYIPIETSEFHQGISACECTLVISIPGAPTLQLELGTRSIKQIAESVGDHPSQADLLACLARHPSASVREVVASRDCLSNEAVSYLMDDTDRAVRLALFWSAAFRRLATGDWLLKQAGSDASFACDLIRDIDQFSEIEPRDLLAALARSKDPAVRAAVAERREAGRAILRRLSEDSDGEVRIKALETLNA